MVTAANPIDPPLPPPQGWEGATASHVLCLQKIVDALTFKLVLVKRAYSAVESVTANCVMDSRTIVVILGSKVVAALTRPDETVEEEKKKKKR